MSTQRMGGHYFPAADAHAGTLMYVAAAIVLCSGVMVAAVEHRRHDQERKQIRNEIDGLERWLAKR